MKRIILASGSPRRSELLKTIGLDFDVIPDDTPENADMSMPPEEVVMYLAGFKGNNVQRKLEGIENALVISADTVVVLDGKIIGKPKTRKEAFEMLTSLSGRSHRVYTGVCVCDVSSGKTESFFECTEVFFKTLTPEEIEAYIKTGEPMDKAGAYGIQEYGAAFVEGIHGDYFNVVGLPVCKLCKTLKEGFGLDIFD